MNQNQRRLFLIQSLLRKRPSCRKQIIPADSERQRILLRGLMSIRNPHPISPEFLETQATYACINQGQGVCPHEIEKQSICIDGDIGEVLARLR